MLLAPHWPGRLNADARGLLAIARGDLPIVDHWTASLSWLWRRGHEWLGVESGGVLLLQTCTLVVGIYLVLRSCLGRPAAALLTLPVTLAPATFGFVGLIGRDSWFVAATLLAVGCAVTAARSAGRQRRAGLVAAGLLAGTVAIAARQNGFTAVAPVFVTLAAVAFTLVDARRLPSRIASHPAIAASATGAVATVVAMVAVTGTDRAVREHALHPESLTFLYDLGYLTLKTERQLIPRLPPDGVLAQTPEEVRRLWLPHNALYMRVPHPEEIAAGTARKARLVLTDEEVAAISRAWRQAIIDHPVDYLRGRAFLWRLQAGIGHTPDYVRAAPSEVDKYGYEPPAIPAASAVSDRYSLLWAGSSGNGGFVHHAWFYLLVCVGGLILALPRFAAPVRAAAALPAAAVVMIIGGRTVIWSYGPRRCCGRCRRRSGR